ncbi:DNA cytosine methyltransferase [Bacillus proteolyticus]|uniref:DNA cytosine methyltransferase n=1 Tax=Bacillus proteolyticus TaxID=2026192 RepID=UPI003D303605
MAKIKLLELFSGTQSISKAFRAQGHEVYTIDFNPVFNNSDWCVDILKVTSEEILKRFGKPDVIWASPPCTKFSIASCSHHWLKEGDEYIPRHAEAEEAATIVKHTIKLIEELSPKYWFMENPRGMLRKMPFMAELPRYTVTYCQYGDTRMKPTDIWTNHPEHNFLPMCRNGAPCHESAPRGSRTGTQGLKNAIERSKIPDKLCKHICEISTEERE